MKVVINTMFGTFGLSEEALGMLKHRTGESVCSYDYYDKEKRTDKNLVEVVEALGNKACSRGADLVVVNIPNKSTDWDLEEYDGMESVIYVVDGKIHRK